MTRVRTFLFAGVAVLLMAGAACGSSSSSGSSSSANAGLGVTTTTPPATTQSGDGGGGSDSGFCGAAKKDVQDLQREDASLFAGGLSPNAIKNEFTNLQNAYAHAQSQAPAAIKPDLAVIVGFIGKLNHVLASNNYNLQIAAPQLESLASSTQLKQAGAHLKAWAAANCGA